MSKTQKMVSVPFELAEQAAGWLEVHSEVSSIERVLAGELREAMAKPDELKQGEPVAMPVRMKTLIKTDYADGWNACVDLVEILGPLYTSADPGEVDHLGQQLSSAICKLGSMERLATKRREERDTIRTQLAERDALLREARDDLMEWTDTYSNVSSTDTDLVIEKIDAALSASAEPSADHSVEADKMVERDWSGARDNGSLGRLIETSGSADLGSRDRRPAWATDGRINTSYAPAVERDERAAFERFARSLSFRAYPLEWLPEQSLYGTQKANIAWQAWQARAALERNTSDDIPDFTPGNGNKAERRATKLLAQLQADLTARDEQIDALSMDAGRYRWLRSRDLEAISQGGVFAGLTPDNLVLNEETLDQAIDAAMAPDYVEASTHGRLNGVPASPCSGCGTPGYTGNCDKCIPY